MRLWASTDSITFDEFVPFVGEKVEVALGLSPRYIGNVGGGQIHGGFPMDLSALGEAGLIQLPTLGRTECALTGLFLENDGRRRIESAFSMHLLGPETFPHLDKAEPSRCEALGRLSLSGKELSALGKVYYPARIKRFQSLCLAAHDERFGQWFDVLRYGDLGSDPDVIGMPVCVVELELLL